MIKEVKFCNVPYIFPNNAHMLLFDNKEKRNEYYDSRVLFTKKLNIQYDDNLTNLYVPSNLEELKNVNYLFFDDKFFMVSEKDVISDKYSRLTLQFDVLQTYIYDCTFFPSFVDRCHVPRLKENGFPTDEVVSEGLGIGDYVHKEILQICELTSSCVLATTTPLGKLEENTDFNPVD